MDITLFAICGISHDGSVIPLQQWRSPFQHFPSLVDYSHIFSLGRQVRSKLWKQVAGLLLFFLSFLELFVPRYYTLTVIHHFFFLGIMTSHLHSKSIGMRIP